MRLKLQEELEPLLTKLSHSAEAAYDLEDSHNLDTQQDGGTFIRSLHSPIKPELDSLLARFRGYYTLDEWDQDPLADRFAEPTDRWPAPTSGSVYCHVVEADDGVEHVRVLVRANQWVDPKAPKTWEGDAATAFDDHFLSKFKATAMVHAECAREMATAAKTFADAVELAKECVIWICKSAIFRVGGGGYPGEPPQETPEEGRPIVKETAGFAAILADAVGLFLAVVPPFELLPAGLAATGVIGGLIAESKDPQPGEPIDVIAGAGSMVENTLPHVQSALNALDRNIADLDEKINRGLEHDLGSNDLFEHPEARILCPDTSKAYKKSTIPEDTSKDLPPSNALVTNVVELYYAGYVTLPVAAAAYDDSVQVCTGARISRGVGRQFPRSVPKFNEAVETFRGLLVLVREDLTRSGQSMVAAARSYEFVDAYNADLVRQFTSQIPSPNDHIGTRPEQDLYAPPEWLPQ